MVKRKQLVEDLTQRIVWSENYLMEKAHSKNSEYHDFCELPDDAVPLHVNDGGLSQELAKARLAGENIDTPKWWIRALNDVSFDYEEYFNLGRNDGELSMIDTVLSLLGEDALAQRAANAIYRAD